MHPWPGRGIVSWETMRPALPDSPRTPGVPHAMGLGLAPYRPLVPDQKNRPIMTQAWIGSNTAWAVRFRAFVRPQDLAQICRCLIESSAGVEFSRLEPSRSQA